MRYLVTGGAGFIGSNFIRFLFNKYGDDAQVVNLDKLTYAGIRENLAEYEGKSNYRFVHGDIANAADVAEAAPIAGLSQTTTAAVSADWQASRLVAPKTPA